MVQQSKFLLFRSPAIPSAHLIINLLERHILAIARLQYLMRRRLNNFYLTLASPHNWSKWRILSPRTKLSKLPPQISDRLRIREAAELAHCSPGMIYVWISENRFKSWTVVRRNYNRGTRYIDGPGLMAWLASQGENFNQQEQSQ